MSKQKNPLDLIHETIFSLYDFKTLILNAPKKLDALKFLWYNFNEKGFLFFKRFQSGKWNTKNIQEKVKSYI